MTVHAELFGAIRMRAADADRVEFGSARQRAILAALALRPGRVVARSSLVTWLWGDLPSPGAAATVQSHVSGLRRSLDGGRIGGTIVRSVAPGYCLDLSPEAIDVGRFRLRYRDAVVARDTGDPARSAELAREAIALWTAPPLQDIEATPPVLAAVRALEVELRDALVLLARTELAMNRTDFVPDVAVAAADLPHDEVLAILLAEGLYRTGQQAEGLATLDALRRRLAEDLGVDESPDVAAMRAKILRHDIVLVEQPVLEVPRASTRPEPADLAVPLAPPHRRVPAERLRGRRPLLDRLVESMLVPSPCRVEVLHGLGGCGKTSLAIELAHQARDHGRDVWWIRAEEPSEMSAALRAVAYALGASADELRRRYAPDVLWSWLLRTSVPWLLVLDNVDDPATLAAPGETVADATGWLREPPPHGFVVVTSRDGRPRRWASWVRLRPVERLDDDDSSLALRDRAPGAGDRGAARRLARRLGGLPLAIDQAGTYLATASAALFHEAGTPTTFDTYLAALDHRLAEMTREPPGVSGPRTANRRTLVTTWNLSLEFLDRELAGRWGTGFASTLLRVLSCLASAPVPGTVLRHSVQLPRSPLFGAFLTSGALSDGLDALAGLGLIGITAQPAGPAVTLHPLVREVVRSSTVGHPEAPHYASLVVGLVRDAITSLDPIAPGDWPRWRVLAPHCPAALTLARTVNDDRDVVLTAADAAHRAGTYQAGAGLFANAERTLTEVLAARQEHLGESHGRTLETRHELARARGRLGHRREAAAALERIVAERTALLGPAHQDTLASRWSLAELLREQGRAAQAAAAYRSILADQEAALGGAHRETLGTRHELTQVLRELGHDAEAQYGVVALLDTLHHAFGPDHPEVLAARHNRAVGLRLTGRTAEAEGELRAVYAAKASLLGPSHRETLATRNELAQALRAAGRLDEAEAEFEAVIAIAERALGPEEMHTLRTRHHLIEVRAARGAGAEAENEFRMLLERQTRMLGTTHPDTLRTRHSLASTLAANGARAEARRELAEVVVARTTALGPDHPDTVVARDELAALPE